MIDYTKTPTMVVLPGGFVYVGYLRRIEGGDPVIGSGWYLSAAVNVRKFGTDGKALATLAMAPTKDTVIDDIGTVLIPESQLLHAIPCDPHGWAKVFK